MKIEIDNLIAMGIIGAVVIVAIVTHTTTDSLVATVVGGLIGYIAKSTVTTQTTPIEAAKEKEI